MNSMGTIIRMSVQVYESYVIMCVQASEDLLGRATSMLYRCLQPSHD